MEKVLLLADLVALKVDSVDNLADSVLYSVATDEHSVVLVSCLAA